MPSKIFLTKGAGRHKERLASFEVALRSAGLAQFNLVHVSSIFPPGAKLVSKETGLALLHPGQIVYVVMSRNETDEPNRLIGASIGVAIPKDNQMHGYLSEHHSFGDRAKKAGDYAEDLAATMLASTLGIHDFDLDASYDVKKELWRISGKIVKSTSVTQTARGKDGLWTSVIAAAVLILDEGS